MTDQAEIEAKFWKALKSDRTTMLGLHGGAEGHAQPMTAQLGRDEGRGPVWFFTDTETEMVHAMGQRHAAVMHFSSKGHDLFACVHGTLVMDNDRATIDRLWNPFIAAWFKGGKNDPKLRLVRFDPDEAQIWLNENNLFAGIKMLLGGVDPQKDYADKVAEVRLS